MILMARTERDQTQREIGAYRGVPVLHFPLVVVGASQSATSVELDVELVGVGPGAVDVHAVVIVGVACRYSDNERADELSSCPGDYLPSDQREITVQNFLSFCL